MFSISGILCCGTRPAERSPWSQYSIGLRVQFFYTVKIVQQNVVPEDNFARVSSLGFQLFYTVGLVQQNVHGDNFELRV